MRMTLRLAACCCLGLALSGCYYARNKDDTPWKMTVADKIEVGKTTKDEVLRVLGPPRKIVKLLDSEALVYEHVVEKRTGFFGFLLITYRQDIQRDAVTVIVDRSGVVRAVGSRLNAEEASFGTPWGS